MNTHGEWRTKLTTLKNSLTVTAHEISRNAKIDLNRDPGAGIENGQSQRGMTKHTETNGQEKRVTKFGTHRAYIQGYTKSPFIVDFGVLERAKKSFGHQQTRLPELPAHTRGLSRPKGLRGEWSTT